MSEKTIADVLDKSVDLIGEAAGKISGGLADAANSIKLASPEAWRIAVRKHLISGLTQAVACGLLALVVVASAAWGFTLPDGRAPSVMIGTLVLIVLGFIASDGIATALNPEYYAAKDILDEARRLRLF